MEANELRIGNLVYHEDDMNAPFQIDELYKYDADDYHPIYITEQWLVKFGFKNIKGDYYNSSGSIRLMIYAHICDVLIYSDEDIYGNPQISWIRCSEVYFIHSLQNLYFALTGEELTINN